MSDASASELHVDVAAFLPDGVTLETSEPGSDVEAASLEEVEQAAEPAPVPGPSAAAVVDLDALDQVERDLAAVDAAIAALDAGTYGIDPATGEPIDDAALAEDPTRLS